MNYESFIHTKSQVGSLHGFKPVFMPDCLFDFQKELVDYSINQGRSAIFADCGLGKTLMELVYAENVARHTGRNVLILTTCAVASQFVQEGDKFDIKVTRSHAGEIGRITVCNYERLHLLDPNDFAAVICDESSILKNFKGKTRLDITIFMRKIQYRLLATATPSPNDLPELGTSSEVLGYLGHMDMLNKFFKNDLNNSSTGRIGGEVIKWRLKGHARQAFWRWVASWSRAIRKPSDMGYEDGDFILPSLTEIEHVVEARRLAPDMLFALPAVGMKEQREERRRSIQERCEKAASLVNGTGDFAIVWCHMNDEGDLLEKLIPDAIQVSGKDGDEKKEAKLIQFANGQSRVLVTKPVIGAWGLNLQHCNHMTAFPSHSYEQYYQSIRRCWRFGQKRPVKVDVITTEGEHRVLANLQRKAKQADDMFSSLTAEMNNVLKIDNKKIFNNKMEVPNWL
jgi:hypothetical protein